MTETLQEDKKSAAIETSQADQANVKSLPGEDAVSEMLETLKSVKIEEQELLSKQKGLLATQNDLLKEVVTQIDAKKKSIAALKSQVAFMQNKCNELERALGIPVYE